MTIPRSKIVKFATATRVHKSPAKIKEDKRLGYKFHRTSEEIIHTEIRLVQMLDCGHFAYVDSLTELKPKARSCYHCGDDIGYPYGYEFSDDVSMWEVLKP